MLLRHSLAQLELVAGNVEQASEAAEHALALDSETFDASVFTAWYGALSGREPERASSAGEEALKQRPHGTRAWAAAGYGAAAAGNYADGVAWFDKVTARAPLVCCWHSGRALAHLANGSRAPAERDLRKAVVLSHDRCHDALILEARLAEKTPEPA